MFDLDSLTAPRDPSAACQVDMYRKVGVDILGMVENMAYLEGLDGQRQHIFGEGGVRRTAEQAGVELLGEVPLDMVRAAARRAHRRQQAFSPAFCLCHARWLPHLLLPLALSGMLCGSLQAIRVGSDMGLPIAKAEKASPSRDVYREMATKLARKVGLM